MDLHENNGFNYVQDVINDGNTDYAIQKYVQVSQKFL